MEQISQKFKFNLRSIFAILLVLAVLCFIGVPFMGVSAKLTSYVGLALGLLVMGAFWLPLFLSRMVLANNNAQEQDRSYKNVSPASISTISCTSIISITRRISVFGSAAYS